VPVENLILLDEPEPEAAKPMPTMVVEEIKERIASAQQRSLQHLDDDFLRCESAMNLRRVAMALTTPVATTRNNT
jgi:hypothetical protein